MSENVRKEPAMSDIVERLENRVHDAPMPSEHLMDESAAEIRHLRAELAEARAKAFEEAAEAIEELDGFGEWWDAAQAIRAMIDKG